MKTFTWGLFFFFTLNIPTFWGFFGHQRLNRLAVFTLPETLLPLYKNNIEYITAHAIDPDKRRYNVPAEGYRHYIDLDKPLSRPLYWNEAQIVNTDIFIVTDKKDTFQLIDYKQITKYKKDYGLKTKHLRRLIGRDSVWVSDTAMRSFFFYNLKDFEPNTPLSIPLDSVQKWLKTEHLTLKNAQSAFAIDHLSPHGLLPYHLVAVQQRLTQAFVARDKVKILRLSAEIGHYIADAHVPLHTTSNYDGQLSGQKGLHAFWESRLPELFADAQYDFWVGNAFYIKNPTQFYWDIVRRSFQQVPTVLKAHQTVTAAYPEAEQYCLETIGQNTVKKPCAAYARAYHEALGGMVERQMQAAVLAIGAAWYTAWIDAGQPDVAAILADKNEEKIRSEGDKNTKMLGRDEGQ